MTGIEIRLAALDRALTLAGKNGSPLAGSVPVEQRAADAITVARQFEAYVIGGDLEEEGQ